MKDRNNGYFNDWDDELPGEEQDYIDEQRDIAPGNGAQNTRKKKNPLMIFAAIVGVALVLLTVWALLTVQIGESRFFTGEKMLDLRDSGLTSVEEIYRLSNPEHIDLRNNNIPAEEIMALAEEYPDCEVLWTVSVAGQKIDSDATSISVAGIRADEVDVLRYFTQLKSIDAKGVDYQALDAILKLSLDCSIDWDIAVGDQRYAKDTTSIVLGDVSDEEVRRIAMLPNIESVDATGCTAYDALLYLKEQLPECAITWTVDIYGMQVTNDTTLLNFNRTKVTDIQRLDADFEKLKYLPVLTEVDMCGCGVASEQMAVWRDKYPEKKFVWEITFGNKKKRWTIRTDIEVFSTLLSEGTLRLGDQNMYKELFLYCTDLKVLDLGHNVITDLSMVTNLKKLQGIILMGNPLSDFTPLAQLPELVFAELNQCHMSDVSWVRDCPKLEHLDVSAQTIRDMSPLADCKTLKYVIMYDTHSEAVGVKKLKETNPTCVVVNRNHFGSFQLLRNTPLRSEFRLVLKNYNKVEYYNNWMDFKFRDGVKLELPNYYRKPNYYLSGRYAEEVVVGTGNRNYAFEITEPYGVF